MPQLNPAPWFYIFIITWIITLILLKSMAALQNPTNPTKNPLLPPPMNWLWL